jgi:hypothetical protein
MPSLLVKLARFNRTAVFLVALALVLAALFLRGTVGGLLLLVIAGLLGMVLASTWPVLPAGARILRASVLVLLVITALSMMF